jgi:serine/threonine protein kinase
VLLDKKCLLSHGISNVYKIWSSVGTYSLALKTINEKNQVKSQKAMEHELNIVQQLDTSVNCNLINYKVIGGDSIVFPLMQGDLKKISDLRCLSFEQIIRIVKALSKQMNCLMNKGLYFTDLKLSNILYKCIDDHNISVVIGDLGSISAQNGTGKSYYTYLPSFIKKKFRTIENKRNLITWLLLVMSLDLCLGTSFKDHISNIKSGSWELTEEISDYLFSEFKVETPLYLVELWSNLYEPNIGINVYKYNTFNEDFLKKHLICE